MITSHLCQSKYVIVSCIYCYIVSLTCVLSHALTYAELNRHTAHFKMYQTVRIAKLKAELKAQENACAAQWTAAAQDGPYEKGVFLFGLMACVYVCFVKWYVRAVLLAAFNC